MCQFLLLRIGPLHPVSAQTLITFSLDGCSSPLPAPLQCSLHSGQQRAFLPRAEYLSIGAGDIWGWTTLCVLEMSRALERFSNISVSGDNQNCGQRLPDVPWEARSLLVEKHWLRDTLSLNLTFKVLHDLILNCLSVLSFFVFFLTS